MSDFAAAILASMEFSGELEAASALVTDGWGMIPVTAHIGAVTVRLTIGA